MELLNGSTRLTQAKAGTKAEFLWTDLDGTIFVSDSLWQSALELINKQVWYLFLIPFWLIQGKAVLKNEIARRVLPDISKLPQREDLIEFLRQEKLNGRKLILATGADRKIAYAAAEQLGFFDEVLASDGVNNLTGERKRDAILAATLGRRFDYIGNGREDIPVWKAANCAFLVDPSPALLEAVSKVNKVGGVFKSRRNRWAAWQSLRPQHWVKNLLVFVPIVMAHQLNQRSCVSQVILAFLSFSLCASAVYILNDLLDLQADRLHPKKKVRPFASGDVAVWVGVGLVPLLLGFGIAVGILTSSKMFLGMLGIYMVRRLVTLYMQKVSQLWMCCF